MYVRSMATWLNKLFTPRKKSRTDTAALKTFTEYQPMFTAWDGSVYEQELTRAAIDRFATAASKLKPEYRGTNHPAVERMALTYPNQMMTWPKFLYRLATVYEVDSNVAIIPGFAKDMQTITAVFPLKFEMAEVVEYAGKPWVIYHTGSGDEYIIEYENTAIISKHQYRSDIFGEANCIDSTMKLIHAQEEAQENAIKNGATIRFIGALAGQVREEDMKKKRERFIADNLATENSSGLMLYDQTFTDIKQVSAESYTVNPEEMKRIQDNVCSYFGTNEHILQNSYNENEWAAYYEGKVEPFAIQVGEGLSKMLFSQRELRHNSFSFSSNRLEYASMASKRNMIRDMLDRGVLTINQCLEILQLPKIGPEGDVRIIRGEYMNALKVGTLIDGEVHDKNPYDTDIEKKLYDYPDNDTEEEDHAD